MKNKWEISLVYDVWNLYKWDFYVMFRGIYWNK